MKKQFFSALSAVLATCAISVCTTGQASATSHKTLTVGWIQDNCLAIKKLIDTFPTTITIIDLSDHSSSTKAITKAASSRSQCVALRPNRSGVNKANGYRFYMIKSARPIYGIGILGEVDTSDLSASQCTTIETVHFSLNKNKRKIWSGSYYLGYDVTPTCH